MTIQEQAAQSIVHLGSRGFPLGEALGVLCGKWIFTCAHYFESLRLYFLQDDLIEVWRAADGTQGNFAVLHASSMDFMILAPDGMIVVSSEDDGPTQSSWDVIYSASDAGLPLKPCEITFLGDADKASVEGFFFGPDGKTIHQTTFELVKHSALITFHSNDAIKGCSGGPLFTSDGKLVGIYTNSSEHLMENGLRHCIGRRIDLCIPRLFQAVISWESITFGTSKCGDSITKSDRPLVTDS
jgi:hypothetical protein